MTLSRNGWVKPISRKRKGLTDMSGITRVACCRSGDEDGVRCYATFQVCWICDRVIDSSCEHVEVQGHSDTCSQKPEDAERMRQLYPNADKGG